MRFLPCDRGEAALDPYAFPEATEPAPLENKKSSSQFSSGEPEYGMTVKTVINRCKNGMNGRGNRRVSAFGEASSR